MLPENYYEKLTTCPYCHSTQIVTVYSAPDRLTHHEGEFWVSQCAQCKLAFQNPRITESRIQEFYTDDLGYYNPPEVSTDGVGWKKKLKKELFKQTLINHFNYTHLGTRHALWWLLTRPLKRMLKIMLMPRFTSGGKALEIGCAYGGKLAFLKQWGWEVHGVEMNTKSATYAREHYHIPVENTVIEQVQLPAQSQDVILLNMVLEHLYEPFNKLKTLTQWLKPGGQLIFSIPYFEGFEFSLFKQYTYALHLPAHITFLNKKIITEYLHMIGYDTIDFYFQSFDRDLVSSAYFRWEDHKGWLDNIIGNNKVVRRLLIKPFMMLMGLLGKTSRVTVHATKKSH